MTPLEANEEARVALANAKWNGEKARIESGVLECLLATAEREAKQAKVLDRITRLLGQCDPDAEEGSVVWQLRAALESKGGQ